MMVLPTKNPSVHSPKLVSLQKVKHICLEDHITQLQ